MLVVPVGLGDDELFQLSEPQPQSFPLPFFHDRLSYRPPSKSPDTGRVEILLQS